MNYVNIASKLVKIGVDSFLKVSYICYVLFDLLTKQITKNE
jgi:hypothetical protein